MLISPSEVKASSYLGDNFDEQMLGQAISEAQEVHLQGIIGTALLDKLKSLIGLSLDGKEGGIEAAENAVYKTLLDDYITPYLADKTQAVVVLPITQKTLCVMTMMNGQRTISSPIRCSLSRRVALGKKFKM